MGTIQNGKTSLFLGTGKVLMWCYNAPESFTKIIEAKFEKNNTRTIFNGHRGHASNFQ